MDKRGSVQALIDNGYHIIPIAKGEKRPAVSGWQNLRITSPDEIMPYLDKGCGIGILTGVGENPLCGVDIDSMDEGLVDTFTEWCRDEIGFQPDRIGKPPKRLLLYRAEDSYTKMSSREFIDDGNNTHKLEMLGAGQQFVAFGTHPDTGNRYRWVDGKSPVSFSVDRLGIPLCKKTIEEMIEKFEEYALALGLTPKANSSRTIGQQTSDSAADILMNYEPKVELPEGECCKIIETLDCEDYDTWLRVGMALHHEFDGGDEGLEIWNDWSKEGTNYRSFADLKGRWAGFCTTPGRTPVTMRSIVHEAKEVHKEEIRAEKRSLGGKMYELVTSCNDVHQLVDEVAPELGRMSCNDLVLKSEAEKLLKERFKRLSGQTLPIAAVRKALGKGGNAVGELQRDKPEWLKHWVYISEANRFLNTETGVQVDTAGFRGMYDSETGEDGNAAMSVLNSNMIPKADRRLYMPGADTLFSMDGVKYVNSYSTKGVADLTGESREGDDEAAGVFRRHLELLIGGGKWTREVHLFANFLRYCAEYPGRHMTWAVLLQGSYGDGKSEPITRLMGRLAGRSNIRVVQAQTIESDRFNGWAEGHTFCIIEEIKLHGHNRYDILNRLKPIITNDIIEIRRMQTDSYTAPNTGKYYITTNYKDALPVASKDRRYMILFSQFPEEYVNDTAYFKELFKAIDSDDGSRAIGRWLLSVDYHKDFNPRGHAPHTLDKERAVELSQDCAVERINDILLDSDSPMFNGDYILFSPFLDYVNCAGVTDDGKNISSKILNKYLNDIGYNYIGRHRVDGIRHRVWVYGAGADMQFFTDKYEVQKLLC